MMDAKAFGKFAAWLMVPALFAALLVGCDRRPDDLREWRASDHKGVGDPLQVPGAAAARPGSSAQPEASLSDVVWRSQCALCHGVSGRGDGPQGPLLHATDFTQEAWQKQATDEQIAQAIVEGKGRMPKFEGLPQEVVAALVAHIRGFGSR